MISGTAVDFIGAAFNVHDVTTFKTKNGNDLKKRRIELTDQSQAIIELTIWRDEADSYPEGSNNIISVKNAKIGNFREKTLLKTNDSILQYNPNTPEVISLRKSKMKSNLKSLFCIFLHSGDFIESIVC
jgi:replication factor A1